MSPENHEPDRLKIRLQHSYQGYQTESELLK